MGLLFQKAITFNTHTVQPSPDLDQTPPGIVGLNLRPNLVSWCPSIPSALAEQMIQISSQTDAYTDSCSSVYTNSWSPHSTQEQTDSAACCSVISITQTLVDPYTFTDTDGIISTKMSTVRSSRRGPGGNLSWQQKQWDMDGRC